MATSRPSENSGPQRRLMPSHLLWPARGSCSCPSPFADEGRCAVSPSIRIYYRICGIRADCQAIPASPRYAPCIAARHRLLHNCRRCRGHRHHCGSSRGGRRTVGTVRVCGCLSPAARCEASSEQRYRASGEQSGFRHGCIPRVSDRFSVRLNRRGLARSL